MTATVSLSTFEQHYLICALWSSTDSDGTPLDSNPHEVSPELYQRIKADCVRFQDAYTKLVNSYDYVSNDFPEEQIAHDFWLTRNRHGSGFWDGDYPEPIGKELTDLAHSFGECDLYVGDDGKLYAM